MGYFDKTIESMLNTPIEELEKELRECGVKFVENPEYIPSSHNLEVYSVLCRSNLTCKKFEFIAMPDAELYPLIRNRSASFSNNNADVELRHFDLTEKKDAA